MTATELVNAHKFRSPAVEKLVKNFAEFGEVDPADFTTDEIQAILTEFAKYRTNWVKSNHVNGERAKAGRAAEKDAKDVYRKYGGASVRPTLTELEAIELTKAIDFLQRLGYTDVK